MIEIINYEIVKKVKETNYKLMDFKGKQSKMITNKLMYLNELKGTC